MRKSRDFQSGRQMLLESQIVTFTLCHEVSMNFTSSPRRHAVLLDRGRWRSGAQQECEKDVYAHDFRWAMASRRPIHNLCTIVQVVMCLATYGNGIL